MLFHNTSLAALGLMTIILPHFGCSSSTCTAGESRACVGPGACSGNQVCSSDGANWSSCGCGNATGGASTGGQTSVHDQTATGGLSSAGGVTASGGSTGSSCNPEVPEAHAADSGLSVVNNFVEAGSLHGYASAWSWVGSDSHSSVCAKPVCTSADALNLVVVVGEGGAPISVEPVTCEVASGTSPLCTAGVVPGDPTYESVAAVGFNFNQDLTVDGGALEGITIPDSITITVETFGDAAGNITIRPQMLDANGDYYCVEAGAWTSGKPIPINHFSTECWGSTGKRATTSTAFRRLDMFVPSHASLDRPFSFCLTDVSVQ